MALGILKKVSPEYVLGKAFMDIKKSGLNGLRPYLTKEANKKIDLIQAVSSGIDLFSNIGMFTGSSTDSKNEPNKAVGFLLEKLSECEFGYKDMLKGSESATAVISFKYKEMMEGTVDISMIKQDKEWKIDNLSLPHFDKFTIPQSLSSDDHEQ